MLDLDMWDLKNERDVDVLFRMLLSKLTMVDINTYEYTSLTSTMMVRRGH